MDEETKLWAWFLFGAGLAPQRAKTLLYEWEQRGLTLQAVLEKIPTQAKLLGLSAEETAKLHLPHELPEVTAVRWNEPLYPVGLHTLPLKLRPALLFYSGDPTLLMRPIVYLAPGILDAETQQLLQETIGILLGENLLLATFRGSPQATLLLEEMSVGEGEVLFFVKQGLAQLVLTAQEQTLLQAGRLLILSPLAPGALPNPALDDILQQVAVGAALRQVCSNTASLPTTPEVAANTLLLSATNRAPLPHGIHSVESAPEALMWLLESPTTPVGPSPSLSSASEPFPAPPPTPAEALRILEKGGRVPEVLRKRLLSQ